MRSPLAVAALLVVTSSPALADTAPPKKAAAGLAAIDISAIKDKLIVLGDGKKHFVAVVPFGESVSEHLFYGDGKSFYKQRVASGGASGTESFDRIFWDPRVATPYKRSVSFRDNKYTVQCGERIVEFKPLSERDTKATIAAATFFPPLWTHRAYALARDEEGNHYYVDKLREPEDNKVFRLYVGPKGAMKLQKMTNVISDSEGDMFATKSGQLRLILGKNESTWVEGKAKTRLLLVPVEDNGAMIYSELGPYLGERLGTPCDDF
jgi:hypothetical protein